MKHNLIYFFAILMPIVAIAQPSKDASLSLYNITTYQQDDNLLGRSNGFAITRLNSDSTISTEIISIYSIFNGATKALLTDTKGKQLSAKRITGANDLYDVVRFSVDKSNIRPLNIASKKLSVGNSAYILCPTKKAKTFFQKVTISDTHIYGGLTYYTISLASDSTLVGCPLLNDNGEVVGVIQKSASKQANNTFAIGIEFDSALEITTVSAADPSLNKILIPKQLPSQKEKAASYIYLLAKSAQDTLCLLANFEDYISKYPDSYFAYTERAAYFCKSGQYKRAEADYATALEKSNEKADVHHEMSTMLYKLNQHTSYQVYKDWDLNKALSEAQQAYALNASPIFLMQEGKCLYALARYQEAADIYAQINATDFCSPENLYYQARSLEMANGDSTLILSLLDSVINRLPHPLRPEAAPYVYYRAQKYNQYGAYREAAIGYKQYEDLVGTKNLNDIFFYNKEQVELKAKLYPQALADIEKAIQLKPTEYVYYIEKALIETRTGHYEDAIYTASQAQKLDPADSDSYKIIGIAQAELGRKSEARANLQKAYDLGDKEALEWLKSMK